MNGGMPRKPGRPGGLKELLFRDALQPAGLVALAAIGAGLLAASLLLEPAKYGNAPPLLLSKDKPAQDGAEDNIAVRIVGMEERGSLLEVEDASRRTRLTQERIGLNLLIHSGYLRNATVSYYSSSPPQAIYRTELVSELNDFDGSNRQHYPFACAVAFLGHDPDQALGTDDDTAARLAIAAVATEKFHRNAWHRQVEQFYAKTQASLFGSVPDLSFGPAQIRPSLIRKMAVGGHNIPVEFKRLARLSDLELMDELMSECTSLGLAAVAMRHFLAEMRSKNACREDEDGDIQSSWCRMVGTANAYIGHRRKTNATIDYGPVVASIAVLISSSGE